MLTWFALVVLIPLVLVPLILFFGFAGCDLIFKLKDYNRSFEAILTDEIPRANRTIVQRIESVRLFRSGSAVRILIQSPSEGDLLLEKVYISQAAESGNPYDSAADLTPVVTEGLFVPADPANGSVVLSASYNLDRTKPLLVAFNIGSSGRVRLGDASATDATAFFGPVSSPAIHEAEIPVRQPDYQSLPRIVLIQQIDVLE